MIIIIIESNINISEHCSNPQANTTAQTRKQVPENVHVFSTMLASWRLYRDKSPL
jgi:hypothetical protein